MSNDEKVVQLLDAKLTVLSFLATAQQVIELIAAIKKYTYHTLCLGLTVFQLQCLSTHLKYHPVTPPSLTLPTSSKATALSHFSNSKTTAVEADLVLTFERVHFYTSLSNNPPLLFNHSDIQKCPFVIPQDRHSVIPEKTAHGVVNKILTNTFWKGTITPEIIELLKDKKCGICISMMLPMHFSTTDEDSKDIFNKHIILWISIHPNTTLKTSCHDTNTDILAILEKHKIHNTAVQWIKGTLELLAGLPQMMCVVDQTDPTMYIHQALMAILGVPLVAEELEADDMQGSLGVYFHEGKNRKGEMNK
ncbi:hypothetical protein FRB99_007397 [Tulasnella sp. 403]|nr:hypothetical protein FRB99_007397 [Tulasnella sp. 403]